MVGEEANIERIVVRKDNQKRPQRRQQVDTQSVIGKVVTGQLAIRPGQNPSPIDRERILEREVIDREQRPTIQLETTDRHIDYRQTVHRQPQTQ